MMNNLVIYEVRERIGYITLNRPEKRNALSAELVNELSKCLANAENDPNCKVIVLSGSGDAFCAGADLAYIQQLQTFSEDENLKDSHNLKSFFLQLYNSSKIIIAKVNGPALAGGCGITNLCDFIYASPEASFGYTEARIGFIPAMVMVFLLRKTEGKSARQLLLSAEVINAAKALEMNLINAIESKDKLDDFVHQQAVKLATSVSGESVALIKQMLNKVSEMPLNDALNYAAEMNVKARKSEDCKKGIASFLAREKFSW